MVVHALFICEVRERLRPVHSCDLLPVAYRPLADFELKSDSLQDDADEEEGEYVSDVEVVAACL